MIVGWILVVVAVALSTALSINLVRRLAEEARLNAKPLWVGVHLPWAMRRMNPVVPSSWRYQEWTPRMGAAN
ncbi:MAG: hypothetical protein ACT4P1_01375 [Sporichthyaceae bacterium]